MTGVPHAHPLPPEVESRVRGLLDGSLSDGDRRAAMEHLRTCTACRDLYDGIARTEHAIAGGADVLGAPALERVAARLQRDLPPPRARAAWMRWGAAVAAAAASVVLVVIAVRPPDDGGFTPRGGGTPAQPVGIRLFRIGPGGASELRDGDSVRSGERLGASYSSGRFGAIAWTVERADGSREALGELSGTVTAGVVDEPIDATVPVDARFAPGHVTVTAVFSGAGVPSERRTLHLTVVEEAAP